MSRSRPAVLSSALLARKGAAAPTGYTPKRPEVVDAETSANDSADARRPVSPLSGWSARAGLGAPRPRPPPQAQADGGAPE